MTKRSYLIDVDERLTNSTNESLKKAFKELSESGKVKAFEIFEVPNGDPVPVLRMGVML